jgi:formyl-CoA transferase
VVKLEHPSLSNVEAMGMGLPIHFSKTPAQFDQPAQPLGAANDEVYRGLLKLSEAELRQLHDQGVV